MPGIVLRPWTAREHLETTEAMALYLEACLEEGDPELVTHALGVIVKACAVALAIRDVGRPSSDQH